MPLSKLEAGKEVLLDEITWGTKVRKKLEDMGLTEGVKFRIVTASKFGPIIISVRGTKLALGRGLAEKISVKLT